jgi:hypothetical protein
MRPRERGNKRKGRRRKKSERMEERTRRKSIQV